MQFTDFVSWQVLATYGGAAAATALIVQFTKSTIDQWFHLPTQLYSYIIAVLVLFASSFFTGTLTPSSAALTLVNGILIAVASNGVFGALQNIKGAKDMSDWHREDK